MFYKIGKILHSPSTVSNIMVGVVAFFLIKLCFISSGFWGMIGPRLGDDAYVYIWGTISTPMNDLSNTPGLASIKEFSELALTNGISDEGRFSFFRVLLRTVGTSDNIFHYLFGYMPSNSLSFYSLFWIQEFIVLFVMSIGVFTLLKNQTQLFGLNLLLPLTALVFLPAQGIHYFIPSTLALSFGMIVWGLVLDKRPRPIILFFTALAAMLSHKIGIAHASIGGWIILYYFFTNKINFKRATIEIAALILALILFAAVFMTLETGNIAVSELVNYGLQYSANNFVGAARYIYKLIKIDPFTLILILLSTIAFVRNFTATSAVNIIISILLFYTIITSIHHLEEYPGEAMIRLLVPVFFLLILQIHTKTKSKISTMTEKKIKLDGFLYLVLFLGMSLTNIHYSMGNIEKRWAQINRSSLHEALGAIGENSHLLFMEEDFALQSSLTAGAYQHKISTASLLNTAPDLADKWLQEHSVTHLVSLIPRNLTPSRRWEVPLWAHRQPGFNLRNGGVLTFSSKVVGKLYLKLDKGMESFNITVEDKKCFLTETSSPSWHQLNDDCLKYASKTEWLISVAGTGSLIGFSVGHPKPDVNWPWGQNIQYEFLSGSFIRRDYPVIKSGFNWNELDDDFDSNFMKNINGTLIILSDVSGLVFVKVD